MFSGGGGHARTSVHTIHRKRGVVNPGARCAAMKIQLLFFTRAGPWRRPEQKFRVAHDPYIGAEHDKDIALDPVRKKCSPHFSAFRMTRPGDAAARIHARQTALLSLPPDVPAEEKPDARECTPERGHIRLLVYPHNFPQEVPAGRYGSGSAEKALRRCGNGDPGFGSALKKKRCFRGLACILANPE